MKKTLVIVLVFICLKAGATHNLSADIRYKWISGLTYEITVTTFTKIQSPADRCELTVYFGDGDSASFPRTNGTTSTNCSFPILDGVQINPIVKYNIYKGTHDYSGNGIYHITMYDPNHSCCILNIPNSVNQPFSVEALLKINSNTGPNSSPIIDNYLDLDTAYILTYHSFNAHATDVDGDSLVYQLMVPVNVTGYSLPSNNFYFGCDTLTGIVAWNNPDTPGYFSYAVRIQEYRRINSITYYLGYTMREILAEVENSSSVTEDHSSNSVSLFPIPSKDIIHFQGNNMNIEQIHIFNLLGDEIHPAKAEIKDGIIDLSDKPKGIYFIRFSDTKGNMCTKKVIVE